MRRRRGGIVGIVVVAGYIALRFGFIAYREHEEGMSGSRIVLSLFGFAAAAFLVIELVLAVQHATARRRDRTLAERHPGARLVPVMYSRTARRDIERVASVLGLTLDRQPPRSGFGTLVADQHGIGLYAGGSEARLVLGITRASVVAVGTGSTASAGRYTSGTVESLLVIAGRGGPTASLDLALYRTVVGFGVARRGDDLVTEVRAVAAAAQVAIGPLGS
jgi:hypothetical protein